MNTFKCRLEKLEPETRRRESIFNNKILPQIVNMTPTNEHIENPPTPDTVEKWEERFERSFNSKHGRNHHALANDGKRSKDCETCQEDNKFNPKGYYLTFLSEQKCYWNRDMMDDVKSFISQALHSQAEEVGKVIDMVWKEMTDRTFNHTMAGKNNPMEVSEEDWANASFTIEEFKEKVLAKLTEAFNKGKEKR